MIILHLKPLFKLKILISQLFSVSAAQKTFIYTYLFLTCINIEQLILSFSEFLIKILQFFSMKIPFLVRLYEILCRLAFINSTQLPSYMQPRRQEPPSLPPLPVPDYTFKIQHIFNVTFTLKQEQHN